MYITLRADSLFLVNRWGHDRRRHWLSMVGKNTDEQRLTAKPGAGSIAQVSERKFKCIFALLCFKRLVIQ